MTEPLSKDGDVVSDQARTLNSGDAKEDFHQLGAMGDGPPYGCLCGAIGHADGCTEDLEHDRLVAVERAAYYLLDMLYKHDNYPASASNAMMALEAFREARSWI